MRKPRTASRSVRAAAGLAFVFLGAGATVVPGSAQVVEGRVLDELSEQPVPLARVTALDEDGAAAGPVTATADGGFVLRLPGPGTYRLRVERLGYPVHTTGEFRAHPFERLDLEIRITPEAIPLAPLEVVARGPERGRDQFTRRRAAGEGVFVDPVHIALMRDARRVRIASDVVRNVEGIQVDWDGKISTALGWRCLVVFLDHSPIPVMHTGGGAWEPRLALDGLVDLNDLTDSRNVMAVEVYRSIDEVPEEVRRGFRWSDVGRCGVVWFWTRVGW